MSPRKAYPSKEYQPTKTIQWEAHLPYLKSQLYTNTSTSKKVKRFKWPWRLSQLGCCHKLGHSQLMGSQQWVTQVSSRDLFLVNNEWLEYRHQAKYNNRHAHHYHPNVTSFSSTGSGQCWNCSKSAGPNLQAIAVHVPRCKPWKVKIAAKFANEAASWKRRISLSFPPATARTRRSPLNHHQDHVST